MKQKGLRIALAFSNLFYYKPNLYLQITLIRSKNNQFIKNGAYSCKKHYQNN